MKKKTIQQRNEVARIKNLERRQKEEMEETIEEEIQKPSINVSEIKSKSNQIKTSKVISKKERVPKNVPKNMKLMVLKNNKEEELFHEKQIEVTSFLNDHFFGRRILRNRLRSSRKSFQKPAFFFTNNQ